MQAWEERKNLPPAAPIADSRTCPGTGEGLISLIILPMARRLLTKPAGATHAPVWSLTMLPAIGASFALDAIQSLTSPPSASSQPIGFATAFSDGDDDSTASSAGASTLSGFSNAQIST